MSLKIETGSLGNWVTTKCKKKNNFQLFKIKKKENIEIVRKWFIWRGNTSGVTRLTTAERKEKSAVTKSFDRRLKAASGGATAGLT